MPATKQAPAVSKATIQQIQDEGAVPFPEARYYFPGRPDLSTLHRWRARGAGGVKLEAIRVGSVWYTSRDACIRFMQRRSA